MTATDSLMVKISPAFKDAIGRCASERDMGMSEFVRQVVAKEIGYNLQADDARDGRGRPRVYKTEEARKQARRRQEQMRVEHRREIVAALMKQERLESIEALERWLAAKGVILGSEELDQSA